MTTLSNAVLTWHRDPRTSSTAPHKQATRKYHMNGTLPQSQEETFNLVGDPILNWLWDGFNSVVMTIGQVGATPGHKL